MKNNFHIDRAMIKGFSLVLFAVAMFGFVLPALFSAKYTPAVGLGVFILLSMAYAAIRYLLVKLSK